MSFRWAGLSWETWYAEPRSPNSSGFHQAKRTLFWISRLWSASATARIAAEPLPLSLMPGPRGTLSVWAPTRTTWSGSPPGVSAITL